MKKSPLMVVFLTVMVDLIGFGIIVPILPLYAENFGASGLKISMLMGIFSFMQLIFLPLWGRLSDRIGRRPVFLISISGNALSLLSRCTDDGARAREGRRGDPAPGGVRQGLLDCTA